MKHKTKNWLRKGRKTKTRKMKGGWNPFSMSFGIPGFGSVGTCPSKQYYDSNSGKWLEQTCTEIDGNKVYKTQYPDSGAASGAATKSWYQFW